MKIVLMALVVLFTTARAAWADTTTTLDAVASGLYGEVLGHASGNYAAGWYTGTVPDKVEARNYFIFDLSTVSGTIVSAFVRLSTAPSGSVRYGSNDPSETYTLFDVSTGLGPLADGSAGTAAFDDIGSGVSYGGVTVSNPLGATVDVPLNAAGLAYLAANHGQVALGGAITTLAKGNTSEFLFNSTSAALTRQLVITTSAPITNFQGLWWNPLESGWGINFAHQGHIIFATWFTYGADNKPQWYTIRADKTADNVYSGSISSFTGLPFNTLPYTANANVKTAVGTATLTFAADGRSASFNYTVDGITQTKQIVPQQFTPGVALPTCVWGAQADLTLATNQQDLWWVTDGLESGWGINFTHQGSIIFASWFTYDAAGKAWWLQLVAPETAVPKVYSGLIKSVTGPPFNAEPFDPDAVTRTTVGNGTITIVDGNHATFDYTVNGITQSKSLVRQVFAAPGTVCQ
jgi:hypothetical protein